MTFSPDDSWIQFWWQLDSFPGGGVAKRVPTGRCPASSFGSFNYLNSSYLLLDSRKERACATAQAPMLSECGTYMTVKARFWPWLSGKYRNPLAGSESTCKRDWNSCSIGLNRTVTVPSPIDANDWIQQWMGLISSRSLREVRVGDWDTWGDFKCSFLKLWLDSGLGFCECTSFTLHPTRWTAKPL